MKTSCSTPLVALLLLSMWSTSTWAQTIATCGKPEGYAYYHYAAMLPKKDSGFTKDKISDGMLTIQKMPDSSYDILIVDASKTIRSMVQDGGKVMLLRKGTKDATFILYFPAGSLELYTFWVDSEGQAKYDSLQSRGGDGAPFHKSSVMVGSCDVINFPLIDHSPKN